MFEKQFPDYFVIENYIKNFYKWKDIFVDNLTEENLDMYQFEKVSKGGGYE